MLCDRCGSVATGPSDNRIAETNTFNTHDTSLVHTAIADAESTLKQLDTNIARLQENRIDCLEKLLKLKALMAPIRRIPPEIMAEIFWWSLPDNPSPSVSSPPLLLGRICSGWRTITLSTAKLWSSLTMTPPEIAQSTEIAMKTWLTRAGSCPLTLDIAGQLADSSVRCLATFSERWEDVYLRFLPSSVSSLVVAKNRLPSLRTLNFDFLFDVMEDVETANRLVIDIFEVAPLLQSVRLSYGSTYSHFLLPWHQLTRCVASGIAIPKILEILQHSPNLIDFEIIDPRFATVDPFSIVTLNRLQTLHVRNPNSNTANFFNQLCFPALLDFSMTTTSVFTDEWPHSQFSSFISQSSCSLTRLQLHGLHLTAAAFIQCLEQMPLLVEMDFLSYHFERDDELLGMLIYYPDSDEEAPCLLRKLEIITFRTDLFTEMSLVGDLITSRWFCDNKTDAGNSDSERLGTTSDPRSGISFLNKVRLYIQPSKEFGEDVYPRLATCKDQGLDIMFMF